MKGSDRGSSRRSVVFPAARTATLLLPLILFVVRSASAQLREPDSTTINSSFQRERMEPMSTRAAIPTSSVEPIGLLRTVPGGFTYSMAVPGWPSGWSYRGLSPAEIEVRGAGIPWSDVLTGQPRYDLLPIQLLGLPTVAPSNGSAFDVNLAARRFGDPAPITEATYWSSNKGLQDVRIVHAQQRVLKKRGRPEAAEPADSASAAGSTEQALKGDSLVATETRMRSAPARDATTISMLFTYGGATATGEYPGSKLERGRQVGTRLLVDRDRWSVALLEIYNRRSVGAHSGVNPPVYMRLGASVANSDAVRETRRNDLAAVASMYILETPLNATVSWTLATKRYTTSADTIEARSGRLAWSLNQRLQRFPVSVVARGRTDYVRDTRSPEVANENFGRESISRFFLGAESFIDHPYGSVRASAGVVRDIGVSAPAVSVSGDARFGSARVWIDLVTTTRTSHLVEQIGFANSVATLSTDARNSQTSSGLTGIELALSGVRVGLSGFATMRRRPLEVVATDVPDSSVVAQYSGTHTVFGASASLGWRTASTRGVYAEFRGDVFASRSAADSENSANGLVVNTFSASLLDDTLPDWHVVGQLGVRRTLFEGDLIADLAVRGRGWSAFTGRGFHAPTGLLVLPSDGERLPSSGTLDIVFRGRVRTATVWLLYENILSGTQLLAGNQLVPGYPLEERRFRFGVHWPISG